MLHEFIKTNRTVLIDHCRAMVASRSDPKPTDIALTHGIPIFIDQLIETLTIEKASEPVRGRAAGSADKLLLPFVQNGEDRSGLGLGLDICRRTVEANNGVLRVRDVPGTGCVFTIDLPAQGAAQPMN